MLTYKGAWYLPGGGYKAVLRGELGNDLASDAAMLGWACRSWKYALHKQGYTGSMILDAPYFGDAARHQVVLFQQHEGLGADGIIGPRTGERLLRAYYQQAEHVEGLPPGTVWQIGAQESNHDLGAIGWADSNDRGPVQTHIYVRNGVPNLTLGQCVRPAYAVPRCAAQVRRMADDWGGDIEVGVASWNAGEGGAAWWASEGKPTDGSPSWWDEAKYGSLAVRCWKYIEDTGRHSLPGGY